MKDNKYFDINPILEGKDLIMTMKKLPRRDRMEVAAERLYTAGSWICSIAFSLASDCELDLKLAVKLLRSAKSDARYAIRILEDLLKEVQQ